jgi:hypothetical protein
MFAFSKCVFYSLGYNKPEKSVYLSYHRLPPFVWPVFTAAFILLLALPVLGGERLQRFLYGQ